jgi:hypothetical protein
MERFARGEIDKEEFEDPSSQFVDPSDDVWPPKPIDVFELARDNAIGLALGLVWRSNPSLRQFPIARRLRQS